MVGTLSAELRQLSAIIGRGRHSDGIYATLAQVEGEGIYLPLHYDGKVCGFWLSQRCWNNWLAFSLATDKPHLLAAELVNAMATWAISPLLGALSELTFDETAPVAMTLLPQWAVVLAFELEGQQLSGVLFDWPLARLAETLSDWHREQAAEQDLLWQAGLVVGWSRLSLYQLQQIRPGDGVRINCAAKWKHGNCWLWQMASPQIYIKLEDENSMTIQKVNDDIDSFLSLDIAAIPNMPQTVELEQLPQTLVMEIGRLTIPLADIKQLAVGQTLACQTQFYGEVNIRLHGQPVGRGSLLCCDEQLVVRIDQWLLRHT
ncbi:YscQ/HrcQ family type III secretion apparatus protein [Yersinia enterocolitica]|nr:YscQ/HrcQ family type III secretion apparatus protein [Yersinia enterocolitica]